MPIEIVKILEKKELEGGELLEKLAYSIKRCEIRENQNKRMIFLKVRSELEKIFEGYYVTEKSPFFKKAEFSLLNTLT